MTDSARVPSVESLLEHREWLRAIARSLVRDENDVDEIEQRTWLTVLRNRRPVSSVRGWLRRVVRSAAVDEHRSVSRRHAREERSSRPEALPQTDHLVAQLDAQRAVAQAIAGLPEPYRTTVLLRYVEELPVEDVARRMDAPVKTVHTRLRRALALLREALDREFGDRGRWSLALLPFVRTRPPVPVGAATTGAVLMAAKTKTIAVTVALALLVSGIVWTATSGTDADRTSTIDSAAATPAPEKVGRARGRPAGPKFAIVGRVRGRDDGRVVSGARVVVEGGVRGTTAPSAETSDDGTFRVEDAVAGALRVTAPRRHAASVEVVAPEAGSDLADVGDVWMDAATALVVEVLGPGGVAIEGADVSAIRTRHHGEVATTNSFLRAMADPDFGTTTLGSARTGAGGIARFEGIAAGIHELVARARGFAVAGNSWVEVPPGRDETRTILRLAPAYRVSGRVVTAAGEPAADRLVDAGAVGWDERSFTRSAADGSFVLEDVPAGDVSLHVGRARGTNPVVAVVRVPDVSEIELRLPPMGAVAGKVTFEDGRPVADAEVGVEVDEGWPKVSDALVRTDAEGRWRIDEIPVGRLGRFEVRRSGLHHVGPRLEAGHLNERRSGKDTGIDPRVTAGGELRLDATMAKGARLHGRIVGPEGGVGGAWIYVHLKQTKAGQEWETAVADAGGRYSFDSLPPGPAAAVPLHPAYVHPDMPKELGTSLAAGTLPASLTFDLPEGGDVERDFTMAAGTRVSGRVLGPSSEPVEGATVRLDAATYSSPPTPIAVTDASGGFVVERAAGLGKSKLRVQARGLVQADVPDVTLAPGGRVDGVEVRMATPPRVTGRVFDGDGAPVVGARVTLPSNSGSAPQVVAWTGATGTYAASASSIEGKLTVTAWAEGLGQAEVVVELSPGDIVADVRFAATSVVAGRVTDARGGPVAGAFVVPRDASKPLAWSYGDLLTSYGSAPEVVRASTGADGRFRVTLPPGEWSLIVRGVGLVDEVVNLRTPVADEVAVEMRPASKFEGRLRGDDGKPLSGAVVLLEPGPAISTPRLSIPTPDSRALRVADRLLSRHTDASGAFAFPGLPEGDYSLVVVLPAATSQRFREVRFGPLRPSSGPFDLSLTAPVSNALAGRVVDAGGVPYRDARIWITVLAEGAKGLGDPLSPPRSVSVDAASDGTFRLEGLTLPSYTFQVTVLSEPVKMESPTNPTGKGYKKTQVRAFHGLRPPQPDVVLEMTELPRLRGRLVDDAGAPLVGWLVTAAPVGDPTVIASDASTGEDGTFEIRHVEDAEFRLLAKVQGQPGRRVVLPRPVRGGMELGDVVATLEARIRGRVVDKAGAVVPAAKVTIHPLRGGEMQTLTSGEDGAFEASGLDPDVQYMLGIVGPDGRPSWWGKANPTEGVRPGTNDVRLVRE